MDEIRKQGSGMIKAIRPRDAAEADVPAEEWDRSEVAKVPLFPEKYLVGLRSMLEAGLTKGQVAALMTFLMGFRELFDGDQGPELVRRSLYLVDVMAEDIRRLEAAGDFREHVKGIVKAKKAKEAKEAKEAKVMARKGKQAPREPDSA